MAKISQSAIRSSHDIKTVSTNDEKREK